MKLVANGSVLDLSTPRVMGILNITPDSFYDGGAHNTITKAIKYVDLMIKYGASIIDVGGESTRPGASIVSTDEEMDRVIPIIEAINQRFNIWISINTSKAKIILESFKSGVHIINDVRSLSEPGSLEAAAETGLPICIMHMQGEPKTMQISPKYGDILTEINDFFIKQIERCKCAGINKRRLLLDPGFGFGKTIRHNYKILAHLSNLHHFNLPILVGISRKSMISKLLKVKSSESLYGSLTGVVIAMMQGAHIMRVHDVKETIEAMHVVKATLSERENKYYYE